MMNPRILPHDHPSVPDEVQAALETGRTLIFPTDTIYGIGGNPWDDRSMDAVRGLKGRAADQPFTLHLSTVNEVERYAQLNPRLRRAVELLLPGPYTLLLPATVDAPDSSVRDGVVGIRVPAHPFFQRIMASLALPLFGTSVNRHGEPAMADIDQIIDQFGAVDLIITGPTGGIASDIIDLTTVRPRAVRGNLPLALQASDSLPFF